MGMGWGGRGFTNSLPNFSDPKSAVEGEIKTDGKEGGLQKRRRELTEGWRGWWAESGGGARGRGRLEEEEEEEGECRDSLFKLKRSGSRVGAPQTHLSEAPM